MTHEPRGTVGTLGLLGYFVFAPQFALKLQRANALFGGTHQMKSSKPFMERNMGVFEDRTHCYRELFPAPVALIDALARAGTIFGLKLGGFIDYAAMRTNRTIGPKQLLQMLPCSVLVLKLLLEKSHASIMRF